MRLFLVRHGQSHSNAATDRVALDDAAGDRLTERGAAEASAAAEALSETGARTLLTSPMNRTAQTAAPIAARLGLEPRRSDSIFELREFDGYTELTAEEQIARRWSARMSEHGDDPGFAPAGAESFAAVVARVRAFKRELAGLEADAWPVVAVSHGIFIRFFLLDSLLGDAFSPGHAERLWHLRTVNCGISVFTLGERGRAVDPELGDWACLSWMIPPTAHPSALRAADRRASAATDR